jgi:Domain of unknown function (DUF4259)
MGAWSVDTFGNDTACDWAFKLEEIDGLDLVRQTLEAVLTGGDDYLDSDPASEALAACELIARLKGRPGLQNSYSETVDKWVEANRIAVPEALTKAAHLVIERILTPPSELLELWEEGDASEWRASVADLRERVGA